jgi:uncharacterized Tic20 family protein
MARIRVGYADGRTEARVLNDGVHRVGRDAGEIVLGDPNVSGNHVELRVSSEQITLTDIGSSNGTYDPNGVRLSAPVAMKPNEPYRLGGCSLTLLTPDSQAAGAPGPSTAGGTQAMPQFNAPPPNAPYAAPPGTQSTFSPPGAHGNYPPGAYAGYPPGAVMTNPYEIPPEARTFGMLCHIGALAGYMIPFGHIIGPLVFWLLKKDQHPFVDQQGKESLNFQITVTIAYAVFGTLSIFLIGIPFLVATGIAALIFEIIAGVRANSGVAYRYPFTLRLLT